MATASTSTETPRSSSLMQILAFGLIGIIAVAAGAGAPLVVKQFMSGDTEESPTMAAPDANEEIAFIPFDEVTVNLEEARFSRFLRINFQVQVALSQKAEIEARIEAKKAIFKNWLQIHLSEKSTEDLKGRFGRNQVRREMQDFFNEVLFDDGIERIQDVLFEEFHVQ